jgi:hypothetical protein
MLAQGAGGAFCGRRVRVMGALRLVCALIFALLIRGDGIAWVACAFFGYCCCGFGDVFGPFGAEGQDWITLRLEQFCRHECS